MKKYSIVIIAFAIIFVSMLNGHANEPSTVDLSLIITSSPIVIETEKPIQPKGIKNYEQYAVPDFGAYSGIKNSGSTNSLLVITENNHFIYEDVSESMKSDYIQLLRNKGFKEYKPVTGARSGEMWLKNDTYKLLIFDDKFFQIVIDTIEESNEPSGTPFELPETPSPSYSTESNLSLALDEFTISYGYAEVNAAVTNNTKNLSYSYIKVKAIFTDADGNIITTDETYANSSTPLLPGERRKFKIFTKVDVSSCYCSISILDYRVE